MERKASQNQLLNEIEDVINLVGNVIRTIQSLVQHENGELERTEFGLCELGLAASGQPQ